MTSNPGDLTARLQRRTGTESAEIEAKVARELKVLGESLRGVAESALRTIEAEHDTAPLAAEPDAAKRHIGELSMENELFVRCLGRDQPFRTFRIVRQRPQDR